MSLFAGMARQAAALPPIRQQAPPQRGRGLFGGGRQSDPNAIGLMERIAMAGQALGGEGTYQGLRRSREEEMRAQALALQQAASVRQNEDRLRAQLSPADGPMGSGSGAAPSIEQQMSALDDARLRDPAVAAQFAPIVQQRRMAGLMAGRPIEEQLAVELNPERSGYSYATQFEDMMGAEGSNRTRGPTTINANPKTVTVNDTIYSIGSGGARSLVTAPPAYSDTRPEIVSTPAGGTTNVFDPNGALTNSVQGNVAPNTRRSYEDSLGVRRFEDDGSPVFPDDFARIRGQAESRLANAESTADNLVSSINQALGLAGGGETGLVGAAMGAVPGTRAAQLRRVIETIKSNVGFNYLQQMRELSPTGGALGNVAVQELQALQSVFGNLDPNAGEAFLEAQLNQVLGIVEQGRRQRREAFQSQYGNAPQQTGGQPQGQSQTRQPPTPEQARARLRSMGVAGY